MTPNDLTKLQTNPGAKAELYVQPWTYFNDESL